MKNKVNTINSLTYELNERYTRWRYVYINGTTDPNHCDGTNLNLIRNHIIYYKEKIEELLQDKYELYPDEYFFPTPIKLPYNFLVKERNIACWHTDIVYKTLSYEEISCFDWSEVFND